MTADQCRYWKGEGCTMELELGIKCDFQTNDLVRGCTAQNNDLEYEDDLLNDLEATQ